VSLNQIHMNHHQFRRGRQKAPCGMVEAMKIVQALAVEAEQLRRNAHGIASYQFTLIIYVRFHDESRTVFAIPIIWPHAQMIHEGIGGLVKRQNVVSHVHMAVIINPLGRHDAGVQAQGGFDPHVESRRVP